MSKHAFTDYPGRGFSEREIVDLVRNGDGPFTDNKSPQAIKGSYLFFPKDDLGRECKLVILMDAVEVEGEVSQGKIVIVCSAFRE